MWVNTLKEVIDSFPLLSRQFVTLRTGGSRMGASARSYSDLVLIELRPVEKLFTRHHP